MGQMRLGQGQRRLLINLSFMENRLIFKHGGYRKLISWQVASLIYDLTVYFCDKYINKSSRIHDQMVQAARPRELREK